MSHWTDRHGSFPDPPDLRWWLAMLLDVLTGTIFFVVWDLVEAAWMRKVQPASRALDWYIAAALFFVLSAPGSYHSLMHAVFGAPLVDEPWAGLWALIALALRLIARFSMRRSLLEHFNRTEPLGLHLNALMTLFFGGLYFQYKFNRVNELKRKLATL